MSIGEAKVTCESASSYALRMPSARTAPSKVVRPRSSLAHEQERPGGETVRSHCEAHDSACVVDVDRIRVRESVRSWRDGVEVDNPPLLGEEGGARRAICAQVHRADCCSRVVYRRRVAAIAALKRPQIVHRLAVEDEG